MMARPAPAVRAAATVRPAAEQLVHRLVRVYARALELPATYFVCGCQETITIQIERLRSLRTTIEILEG